MISFFIDCLLLVLKMMGEITEAYFSVEVSYNISKFGCCLLSSTCCLDLWVAVWLVPTHQNPRG